MGCNNDTGWTSVGDLTFDVGETCHLNVMFIQVLWIGNFLGAVALLIWARRVQRNLPALNKRNRQHHKWDVWTVRLAILLSLDLGFLSMMRTLFVEQIDMMIGGGVLPGVVYGLWYLTQWSMNGCFVAKFVVYYFEMLSKHTERYGMDEGRAKKDRRIAFFRQQLVVCILCCSFILIPGWSFVGCQFNNGCPSYFAFRIIVFVSVPIAIIIIVFFVGHFSVRYVVDDWKDLEAEFRKLNKDEMAGFVKDRRENLARTLLFFKIAGGQCVVFVFATACIPWFMNRMAYIIATVVTTTHLTVAGVIWVISSQSGTRSAPDETKMTTKPKQTTTAAPTCTTSSSSSAAIFPEG